MLCQGRESKVTEYYNINEIDEMIVILISKEDKLTEWEYDFLTDIEERDFLTDKQRSKLHDIWERVML